MHHRVFALAAVAILGMASPAAAQDGAAEAIQKIDLGTMALSPIAAFPGVSNGFVTGAFDAPGLYAAQGEMKKGSVFPPHSHPDVRLTVVLEGVMYLGKGETADPAKLVAYPAGTAALTPAGTPHYMSAPDGDVRVLEIGSGPSGAVFFGRE